MTLRKQIVSGLKWRSGSLFLSQLCTWGLTIITMRILSPADYGLLAIASIFVSFLSIFSEMGLGPAIVQKTEIDETTLRQAFGISLLVNLALCMLLIIVAPIIGEFYRDNRLVPVVRVISVQFVLNALIVIPYSLLCRALEFKKIFFFDVAGSICAGLVTMLLAYAGYGVWALILGPFVNTFFLIVGLNYFFPFFKQPIFSFIGIKSMVGFGGQVTLTRVLWFIYSQADIVVIGKLLGAQVAGVYSVAMNFATLPLQKVSGIINSVAFPSYARIQDDIGLIRTYFLKSVKIAGLISFPLLWGISSISSELVSVLIGTKWLAAVFPLQVVSLVMPLNMIHNLISPMAQGIGRPEIALRNVVWGTVLMPAAFVIGSKWGLKGVCVAWLVMYPIMFYLNMTRLLVKIGVSGFPCLVKVILRPIVASTVMYCVVCVTRNQFKATFSEEVLLLLMIIAGGGTYGTLIFLIDREGLRDFLGTFKG